MTVDEAVRSSPSEAEFGEWISEISPMLLNYFLRRVDPQADAADLVSETVVVLWRRATSIPTDGQSARMWAFGIARRVLATHRRAGRRRNALADRLRGELATEVEKLDTDVRVLDLRTALDGLKPLDREIIRLVHWDGLSLAEVAQHLGKPAGTIRSRYHRAREDLKTRLGN
ncbi:sigma-70 family RNA polymerase sigma factor [Nocardioides rotundus]|uniref:RNA polymerase sigma factor n=1 Tax=Nocardioides rotundus TaxID=1774216 RepID=UPI001CC05A5F|nr:sigma-70 family RNA polymerase sigma factor [Nocardioides rotundus]UAL31743.1 sigma-70 family RNA polymerase sigma factor [Nocardioides rotundus]